MSGVPAEQQLLCANGRLQRAVNALQCTQKLEQSQKAHRTCPVHHRTVWWPSCHKLQRLNPNGWVTWLAHRTVSGGAPDCPMRPLIDILPNGHFGGWGYKYPQPPHIQGIQVFSHCIQYKSSRLHSKTQTRDQILSQVRNHSKLLVTSEREIFVFI